MSRARVLLTFIALLACAAVARPQGADLRERYHARSLEAAKLIHEAVLSSQARKHKQALAAADKAIAVEKSCQMAHYVRGIVLGDLGDIDEAMNAYKAALSDSVRRRVKISADAAINLGLTLARLKEQDESNLWFTRAVLEDHTNEHKLRGKAFRNMAINLSLQGRHLGAALALALAYEDKADNITVDMLRDFFKKADGHESAVVMHFASKPRAVGPRDEPAKLTPAAFEGALDEQPTEILADPEGAYLLAFAHQKAHYYLLDLAAQPALKKITVERPILCTCLVGGHLYVGTKDPSQIEKIEVKTGKVLETFSLGGRTTTSIAVLPAQKRAYFTHEKAVHQLDLAGGTVTKTSIPGQRVAAHPNQREIFSSLRPEIRGASNYIIVNGRPVYFGGGGPGGIDWLQTVMFKAAVTPGGLQLAAARDNAGSNGRQLLVSPDGEWAAVVGGGGWRPTKKVEGSGAGYGVALFPSGNFDELRGFYSAGAHPIGAAINPVTNQVVTLSDSVAHVFHVSTPKEPLVLKGKFSGASAWSGDGRYLALATERGLTLYENALTAAEKKAGTAWVKAINVVPVTTATAGVKPTFTALEALAKFEVREPSRDELKQQLAKALKGGRTARPGRWDELPAYVENAEARKAIAAAKENLGSEGLGVAIFQLKKALKKHPDSAPLQYYLADALRRGEQPEEVQKLLVAVVRADAGRTELTGAALNQLARQLADDKKALPALHCLAWALEADRANPRTLEQARALLEANKFAAEAAEVAKLAAGTADAVTSAELPKLGPPGATKKLTAGELYRKAAWSVVLIKTDRGTGSGVCVGRGDVVLTNNHVVEGDTAAEVYPFILKDGTPVRMPKVSARVIYRSAKEDLAVLKLERAPEHLAPIPVASGDPSPGDKVYAIGSPGLGKEVLEQSISEGLISSNNRMIEGTKYLQHSAAVNPGNSGGPLLDEEGRLVGVVTRRAKLENVSFAIPVSTVRAAFNSR